MNLSMFHDTATHQLDEVSKAGLRVLALSMRKSSGDEVCYQIERAAKSGRLSDYHAPPFLSTPYPVRIAK